jgi:hypothetical protein
VRNFDDPQTGCSSTGFVDTWVEIYTFTDGEIGCFVGENTLCSQDSAYRFSTENICVPSNPTVRYFNQRDPLCTASEINDYQSKMSSLPDYPEQAWPGCSNSDSLFRPHWISFIANTPQMELTLDVGNCDNNQGVKWALYELPCRFYIGNINREINPSQAGTPISSCANVANPQIGPQNINFTASVGQAYAILVDGWQGDLCEINLTQTNAGTLPDLSSISLDPPSFDSQQYGFEKDTVCIGAEDVEFSVPQINGACRYLWRLRIEDSTVRTSEFSPSISLDFPERNTYSLCVFASNYCSNTSQSCIDIEVFPSNESYLVSDTICEGENYTWLDQEGNVIRNLPPQNTPGLNQFTEFLDENEGCSVTANLDLFVRAENEENPTTIDTFICYSEIQSKDFVFYCDTLDTPGNYQNQACISPSTGCDTFFNIQFDILGGKLGYESRCDGQGNMIFEFSDPQDGNYTPWITQIDKFQNDSDFRLQWRWSTAQGSVELDTSSEVTVAQEDIELFAENDTFYLTLNASIFFKGKLLCVSDSTFTFSLKDHFPQINSITGDQNYCLGQEDLQFWTSISDPDTPQHNQPDDRVFLKLWNLPSGFYHIPPSNASSDTINIGAPEINSGNQLCVEIVTDQCAFKDEACLTLERGETPVSIKPLDSCAQNIFTIDDFEGNIENYFWSIDNGTLIGSNQSALVVVEPSVMDTSLLNVEVLSDCIGVGSYKIPPTDEASVVTNLIDQPRDVYIRDCFRGSLIVITEPACNYRWGYIDTVSQEFEFPILAKDSTVWNEAYLEVSDTTSPFRQYFIERTTDCNPLNCESELILVREAQKVACEQADFNLYPNPNSGNFTIELRDYPKGRYDLRIVNSLGQQIQNEPIIIDQGTFRASIEILNLASGFHTALLIQNGKILDSKSIIIAK